MHGRSEQDAKIEPSTVLSIFGHFGVPECRALDNIVEGVVADSGKTAGVILRSEAA